MTKIRCLIVEDEPLAAEVLKDYVEQTPQLELVAVCEDAIFALEILQKEIIDAIFLDIHLPKLKGLDFIWTLKNTPQIILTTAYHQYALEGFELDVVDYLLKPISFSRFLKAVNKLNPNKPFIASVKAPEAVPPRKFKFFRVNKENVKIYLDEILFIESLKDYIYIHTPSKKILTKSQLGTILQLLKDEAFIQVHRSFLVALEHIDAYSSSTIAIRNQQIPIGRTYKDQVLKVLNKLGSPQDK